VSHPPCDRLVVAFELLQRPHPKGRPRFGKTHAYTDPKTRLYENDIRKACAEAMCGADPHDGPVELSCVFEYRGARVADTDNLLKAVSDGIERVAFLNDRQVTRLNAVRVTRADVDRISVAVLAVTA
jgi:Holliday junction resolvase RusA-like endonuclease